MERKRFDTPYVHDFEDQTTVTIRGKEHQLGTSRLIYQVYVGRPPIRLAAVMASLDPISYDLTLTFGYLELDVNSPAGFREVLLPPQSGTVVLTVAG